MSMKSREIQTRERVISSRGKENVLNRSIQRESSPMKCSNNVQQLDQSIRIGHGRGGLSLRTGQEKQSKPLIIPPLPLPSYPNTDSNTYYDKEILRNGMKIESKCLIVKDYFEFQLEIRPSMRATLIDWINDVHRKFHLQQKTFFLAVTMIDRYCEKKLIKKKKYQLLGITCLWVACKYEEIKYPETKDLIYLTADTVNLDDILAMEKQIVKILDFDITYPTVHCFLEKFIDTTVSDLFTNVVMFFSEKSVHQYICMFFRQSLLACGCIYLGRKYCHDTAWWDMSDTTKMGYTESDVIYISTVIENEVKQIRPSLMSVFRKYSKDQKLCVSEFIHNKFGDLDSYLKQYQTSIEPTSVPNKVEKSIVPEIPKQSEKPHSQKSSGSNTSRS